jgi:hypothetical protein
VPWATPVAAAGDARKPLVKLVAVTYAAEMKSDRFQVATPIGVAMLMVASMAQADPPVLKQEPPPGALKAGEVMLVDDGTCGPGKIKQVTGGNNYDAQGLPLRRATPRLYQCIAR